MKRMVIRTWKRLQSLLKVLLFLILSGTILFSVTCQRRYLVSPIMEAGVYFWIGLTAVAVGAVTVVISFLMGIRKRETRIADAVILLISECALVMLLWLKYNGGASWVYIAAAIATACAGVGMLWDFERF